MKNRETIYLSNKEIEALDKLGLKRSDLKKLIILGLITILKTYQEKNKNSQ